MFLGFWSPSDPHFSYVLWPGGVTVAWRNGAGDKYTLQVDPDLRIGPCAEDSAGLKGIIEDTFRGSQGDPTGSPKGSLGKIW